MTKKHFLLPLILVQLTACHGTNDKSIAWSFNGRDLDATPAPAIVMKDKALAECLTDGKMYPETKIDEITQINCKGMNIEDLAGISQAWGLKAILLRDNPISDLSPLIGLDDLSYLDLRGTNIRALQPLTKLVSLKEVKADDLTLTSCHDVDLLRKRGIKVSNNNCG